MKLDLLQYIEILVLCLLVEMKGQLHISKRIREEHTGGKP